MDSPVSILILAAGLGTRMKSKMAKVLHRAGGLTLIEHVVRTAAAITAPENVAAVVGHQAERVREAVEGYGIGFAVQREQLGTGDAVKAARGLLEGRGGLLVVLYGDGPLLSEKTLRELIERQARTTAAATLITTELEDPAGYGRVLTDADGRIEAIVEQKAATPEQLAVRVINSGIYCFDAALLWKHIDEIGTDNPAGEYYLTDMVEIFRRAGHGVETFPVADYSELLGINTRVELAAVDRIFRERKAREVMLAGATLERPETVTIDPDVRIGRDTVVGPFAQILGRTEIGEDCTVGACSVVRDATLGDGARVGEFTIVNDSTLEAGSTVGPYARLRFGDHVGAGAVVGNFVELKKARLGPGASARHLTYLGDAEIGAGVNVGAGTITCNYDGERKHRTKVNDGAFIGSNATLVAPVEIGAGSYVAAGSVITKPVPEGALAIARERQVNKEGWVKRRKEKGGSGCCDGDTP